MKVVSHKAEVIAAKNAAIAKALEMIGLQAENYAHDNLDRLVYSAPESPNYVRTGNLRNKTTHQVVSDDTVVVGSAVHYAQYVEFGTSKMAERPFIRPAAMDHNDEYKAMVETCLKGG